jgi:hypothetical protein
VVTTRRHYKDKVYETVLLRRSYREAGKVKTETLANPKLQRQKRQEPLLSRGS